MLLVPLSASWTNEFLLHSTIELLAKGRIELPGLLVVER